MVTNRRGALRGSHRLDCGADQRHVGELDKELKLDVQARWPQLSWLPRECLPLAAAPPGAPRVSRGPRGHAVGVGDHRHDSSPPAQSRRPCRADVRRSLVWSRVASWPGQPLFTACHRALARAPGGDTRTRFFAGPAATAEVSEHVAHVLLLQTPLRSRADDIATTTSIAEPASSQRAMAL